MQQQCRVPKEKARFPRQAHQDLCWGARPAARAGAAPCSASMSVLLGAAMELGSMGYHRVA
jgi:hypothetical protein